MPRYTFSGHETFPLRFSWLPKAVQGLNDAPELFFDKEEAMVELGVGKNMVRAIRHWGTALQMIEVDKRAKESRVTDLGRKIFLEDGWDPYLEDPATLWLLQWLLTSYKDRASTWYLAFTKWGEETFTKSELVDWLVRIAEQLPKSRATSNSIERDVAVFLRTYIPSEPSPYRPIEDTFDSPLVELGLLREEEDEFYRFVRGAKRSLPLEVFCYSLLDYWRRSEEERETEEGRSTRSFEDLLYQPGSPGRSFQLDERTLARRLESLPTWTNLQFDATAGIRNVSELETGEGIPEPIDALGRYYERLDPEVAA